MLFLANRVSVAPKKTRKLYGGMGLKVFLTEEVCIIVEKLEKIYNQKNNKLDILSEWMYYNTYKQLKSK